MEVRFRITPILVMKVISGQSVVSLSPAKCYNHNLRLHMFVIGNCIGQDVCCSEFQTISFNVVHCVPRECHFLTSDVFN